MRKTLCPRQPGQERFVHIPIICLNLEVSAGLKSQCHVRSFRLSFELGICIESVRSPMPTHPPVATPDLLQRLQHLCLWQEKTADCTKM